jgi:hypothetical protein
VPGWYTHEMDQTVADEQLQGMVKSAVAEILKERPDLIMDALEEAIEDLGLRRAIEEVRDAPLADEAIILKLLAE